MIKYKYEKMIDDVLVKSNYKLDEYYNKQAVYTAKEQFSSPLLPRALKTLILNHPLTREKVSEVDNSLLKVKTVGELIKLLQVLPKDTPYEENFAGLYLDFDLHEVDRDTAEFYMFLTAGD